MIEYTVKVYDNGTNRWYANGNLWVTEEQNKKRTSKAPCQGKVVEIDGIKYKLEEV